MCTAIVSMAIMSSVSCIVVGKDKTLGLCIHLDNARHVGMEHCALNEGGFC